MPTKTELRKKLARLEFEKQEVLYALENHKAKLEVEGVIWQYGLSGLTFDDTCGFELPLGDLMTSEFGARWSGTKVKLTIEEVK